MQEEGNTEQQSQAASPSSSPQPSRTHVLHAEEHASDVVDPLPTSRRTQRSPTPQSHPSRSPTQSRDPSRSPSTSRRSIKRTSTFSPVPEEQPSASSTLSITQPAAKRSRTATRDPDAKKRGQRLFGVLTSTLSQFKRESETDRAASAAHKRAAIEARLASKLKDSEKAIDAVQRRRALVWEARHIAEQIATGDAQRKTLRSTKRRMASFLYTPPPPPNSRTRSAAAGQERLAVEIPTSLAPSRADERDAYAIYFLPGKTLPEQEDALNGQEDDVDEAIDRFDDTWDAQRSQLMNQLDGVKRKLKGV
ncbi:hypothetical protein EX895_002347 [Sporisorium graminicola]|uniref:Pinin/SDK/MemA protein domain-containing protein n=1 Tax=Sporisorium graminicola TaxID=280036 RepID=A0A4U7KWT9_9BASI|nr:hypothetical protein EX895_002347 [Sporisorium graminicola]TKY88716.1 hypothetical protein EX895_002347 [Sporisorium graminicola]